MPGGVGNTFKNKANFESLINDVVACPGLDYCSLAVTRSMGVGDRVRQHLAESGIDAEQLGSFHIKISGCPNSCGQHHIGDIGLTGMMVKDEAGSGRLNVVLNWTEELKRLVPTR